MFNRHSINEMMNQFDLKSPIRHCRTDFIEANISLQNQSRKRQKSQIIEYTNTENLIEAMAISRLYAHQCLKKEEMLFRKVYRFTKHCVFQLLDLIKHIQKSVSSNTEQPGRMCFLFFMNSSYRQQRKSLNSYE